MALPRLIDLGLRLGPRLGNCSGSSLQGRLTARFLTLEQGHARFPQPLLVVRGSRFGLGNIGPRFFDRALGPAAPLGQHRDQGFVHNSAVNEIQQHNKDNGGHGPEQ